MEDAARSRERELKFSLVDPPPAPADVEALGRGGPYAFVALGAAVHVDTYFDDEGGSLARSGWALRTRRPLAPDEGDGEASPRPPTTATLKSAGRVEDALHERDEIEAPMSGGDWPPQVAERLPAHVALWTLRPRLTLEVERSSFRVAHEGRPLAKLAIDRVTARLPDAERTAHFDEVEIEALGDADEARLREAASLLDGLVRLTPSSVTKLARAAAVLELGASF